MSTCRSSRPSRGRARIPLLFDTFISLYDTIVEDRGLRGPSSAIGRATHAADTVACRLADLVLCDTPAHADYFAQATRREPQSLPRPLARGAGGRLPAAARRRARAEPRRLPRDVRPAAGTADDRPRREAARAGRDPLPDHRRRPGTPHRRGARRRARRGATSSFPAACRSQDMPREIAAASLCLGIFGTSAKAGRVVPNKVFECLAVGRPILTADTPAIRDALAGEVATVPAGDPEALAREIRALLADPARLASLGSRGSRALRARLQRRSARQAARGLRRGACRSPCDGDERRAAPRRDALKQPRREHPGPDDRCDRPVAGLHQPAAHRCPFGGGLRARPALKRSGDSRSPRLEHVGERRAVVLDEHGLQAQRQRQPLEASARTAGSGPTISSAMPNRDSPAGVVREQRPAGPDARARTHERRLRRPRHARSPRRRRRDRTRQPDRRPRRRRHERPRRPMRLQAHARDLRRPGVRLDADVPSPLGESHGESAPAAPDFEHAQRVGRDQAPDRLPAEPGVRRERWLPGLARHRGATSARRATPLRAAAGRDRRAAEASSPRGRDRRPGCRRRATPPATGHS